MLGVSECFGVESSNLTVTNVTMYLFISYIPRLYQIHSPSCWLSEETRIQLQVRVRARETAAQVSHVCGGICASVSEDLSMW